MTYVDTTQRDDYTATSGQTVFAYTFRILTEAELKVYDDGVLQTLTTHYTISGVGDAGGGNVTFVTGVTLNNEVMLRRDTPDTQNTDYTPSGMFPAESHEQALDKLTMNIQDVKEDVTRTIQFVITSLLSNIAAPEGTSATDRGGKVWAWDSAGSALELLASTVIDAVSVIAVKGDMVQGDASGDAAKLAIGSTGGLLTVASGLLAYLAIGNDKEFLSVFSGDGTSSWNSLFKKGGDIASAATLPIDTDGNAFDVTGTTTITAFSGMNVGDMVLLQFDGALQLTHHTTNLVLPGAANIITAAGDIGLFHCYATDDVRLVSWSGTTITQPRAYLAGFTLSNDTDTDHDINITAGQCVDSGNVIDMILGSEITKQIDASWAVGDDAGGLSSSLTVANSTWYHVHAIIVAGVVDVGFDTSVTAANLVTDHSATAFRRIGSVLTDGSANILGFTQVGDEFLWDAPVAEFNTANPGTSAVTQALTVPTGIQVIAKYAFDVRDSSPAGASFMLITAIDQTDTVPSETKKHLRTTVAGENASVEAHTRTDTSGQIRYRFSVSSADHDAIGTTLGWLDRRGQDN